MRKILSALFLMMCGSGIAQAAPGDTTWVQANNVKLDYYNNFDTTVVFPSTAKSYRKIYMIFTLGKYVCPGSPQYCGDWDYTVQNFFMAKHAPDTLELGRLITPYAHTGYGPFTANWTRRYIYDVTDYYPALHDTGTVRIHYSGYSGGFTANIRFAFIEGTPERNVLKVEKLWMGDYNYGHGATPINTALGTVSRTAPAGTVSAELKMNITGHGGDNKACAEFCPNVYNIAMNGNPLVQQPFFRSDCSENDLYFQTGTWIYARAGWCPGAAVNTYTHKLTGLGSGAYTIGMSFPAYTSVYTSAGTSPASYTIAGTVVYYGAINKVTDASLEDIIAPTDAEYHTRANPESLFPKFTVRNTGSTAITSIKFEYGVTGRLTRTYTWTGNLPALQNMDITMPALAQLRAEQGTHGFSAKIIEVNGAADADALNNSLSGTFTTAPEWPAEFEIILNTSEGLFNNPAIAQTSWKIIDQSGNVVKQRGDCPVNVVCDDTVRLQPGAYKLVVRDTGYLGFYDITTSGVTGVFTSDGLAFFSTTTGYLQVNNLATGLPMTLPGYYGGNFGAGFTQSFNVGGPVSVQAYTTNEQNTMHVFPNPAANKISVLIDGRPKEEGIISVTDMLGKMVLQQPYVFGVNSIDVSRLSNGVYLVKYASASGSQSHLQQRVAIAR